MGICYQKEKEIKKNLSNQSINNQNNNGPIINKNMYNDEPNFNPRFDDMPEYGNGITKGLGIKQMFAYKCDLKIDELNKLRDEFWSSKQINKQQWKIIHQACIYDHIKAEEYLYKNNMKCKSGCINEVVDANDNVYKVPNFCINDPYFELEILPEDNEHSDTINIILFDITNQKQIKLKVNEAEKGESIIQKYAKAHNINLKENKIRLLFGGGIIKENESLYQHKVKDGFSIQIVVSKIN